MLDKEKLLELLEAEVVLDEGKQKKSDDSDDVIFLWTRCVTTID